MVLFEMATGGAPAYGDGVSDPASVPDEAAVEAELFDPSIVPALVEFFGTALARDAGVRHDTATDMLAAWHTVFVPLPKTVPDDAAERVEQAGPATRLVDAGLSARALSALEPYRVGTVADLVALDAVRLNRLPGVAEATRREVKERARRWREKFAAAVTGRGRATGPGRDAENNVLPDPVSAAELLLANAGAARAESRRAAVRLVLGLDSGLDAFANQRELSAALDVTRGRVAQHVSALQDAWAADAGCRDLLDTLAVGARQALADFGGVATVDELAGAVLATLPPAGPANATEAPPSRIAAGLLRLALDRAHALERADADTEPLAPRRRDGRIALLASDPALLDVAEALGRAADDLLAAARNAGEPVVATRRAVERLRETTSAFDDLRLLRLAAALSRRGVLSGASELHDRDLAPATALARALNGVGGGAEPLTAQEIRDRVRARFPALPPLPVRPRLDQIVDDAGLGLLYDDTLRAFRSPIRPAETTGLESRLATEVPTGPLLISGDYLGIRLVESRRSRSFLALGVDAARLDQAAEWLRERHGATVIDVTEVLVTAMRAEAATIGLPWDAVRVADAAVAGTRESEGLAALVARALPAVDAAIDAAGDAAERGTTVVVLTELGPLARYGHLGTLARWADLAAPRRQAVWTLVPQLPPTTGAVIDGTPLPLAAPGQYLRIEGSAAFAGAATAAPP